MANKGEQSQLQVMSSAEYAERFHVREFHNVVTQIGLMCVRFQSLEAMLRSAIAYFLNPDDDAYGAIVTEKLPFKSMTRALRNLVEYHSQKNRLEVELNAFNEVLAACDRCEQDRNRVVHSLWYPSEEGTMRFKLKLNVGKEQPPPERTSPEEIQELTNKIVSARFALSALFYRNFPEQKRDADSTLPTENA
jgi:hypothetical protein